MSVLIVVGVDKISGEPGPSTFCLVPSNELVQAIIALRWPMQGISQSYENLSTAIDWDDEGCWIEEDASKVEGLDYNAITKRSTVCEVTDFRVEVYMNRIHFSGLYQGRPFTTFGSTAYSNAGKF